MDEHAADFFPCGCLITTRRNGMPNRTITYANRYFHKMLGLKEGFVEGQSIYDFLTPASRILFESYMLPVLKQQGYCEEILLELRHRSGDKLPVVANVLFGEERGSIYWSMFSAVQRDKLHQELLDLKRHMQDKAERFEALSGIDELTGLINRRRLNEHATILLAHAKRHGESIAILLIDIDHFKAINDSFGHLEGDRVLQELGAVLRNLGRESDIIARYGGEEFLILLPGSDEAGAKLAAERFHKKINQIKVGNGFLTVSIGGSVTHNDPEMSFERLAGAADAALYRAKAGGRNQTCF